jgi:hypothetical protein
MQSDFVKTDTPTQYASASATVVFGNGSKSSYVELVASTAFRITWIHVRIKNPINVPALLDIAIGAAASEVDLVPNLRVHQSVTDDTIDWSFPLQIQAGSRISVRGQATGGGPSVDVAFTYGG